jgi:hypothetical protein
MFNRSFCHPAVVLVQQELQPRNLKQHHATGRASSERSELLDHRKRRDTALLPLHWLMPMVNIRMIVATTDCTKTTTFQS